jgi:hypothetical protein
MDFKLWLFGASIFVSRGLISVISGVWFPILITETASASFGSFCVSATSYRRAENVWIVPIIISELKFGNVERQIFAADFVEAAHDAAFQERPKAVNSLGVNNAINVLTRGVQHGLVPFQFPISRIVVSRNQADFFRDSFTRKFGKYFVVATVSAGILDHKRRLSSIFTA